MKSHRIIAIILCLFVCSHVRVRAQDMDTEISNLATNLAGQIKDQAKKKVAVVDFTGLDGGASELGRYVSEQLTVDLVMDRKDFSVLDRANLKKILDEHKLTATGLVDPDNAKKLGQFAGVDALILGTLTPKNQTVSLTAKVITTDTAEIVGAAKATFRTDNNVGELLAHTNVEDATTETVSGKPPPPDLSEDKPKVVKAFGNLVVELQSLKIVNGGQYLLMMTLTNSSAKNSVWVALTTGNNGNTKASLFDPSGSQFVGQKTSGIFYATLYSFGYYVTGPSSPRSLPLGNFKPSTEIKPGDSTTALITFSSLQGARPSAGVCSLQIEFVVGNDLIQGAPERSASPNLVTKFEAK